MNMQQQKIAVLGDGAWGTTLAVLLASKGNAVNLWGAFPEYVEVLRQERENVKFLPGVSIPETVNLCSDLGLALAGADILVTAAPSHVLRKVCERIRGSLARDVSTKGLKIVNVSKGIETDSLLRMSQVIGAVLEGANVCTLSGPSHAEEVSRGIPTAVVSAALDESFAQEIQNLFTTPTFRVYSLSDIAGVEIGGAIKNIIAIATGICDGLGLGDNTKAALMARGLHEMSKLGLAMGADPLTFSGLSGLGDLIATCMSRHSRNRWFGEEIGRGGKVAEVLKKTEKVVEGYTSALSVEQLSRKTGVEMPIVHQVYAILYEESGPGDAVAGLMERSLKPETSFSAKTARS